jgi:metal-responsive CopG/Arc/MetJ family transcriptional regulator
MNHKISITLSKIWLAQIDRLAGSTNSRGAFIVSILRRYVRERRCCELHTRDMARINRAAERLNREALEVLEYQGGKI